MKQIAVNKSASFEYFIEEKFEAGIVLEGSEVKSLRAGKASLNESFCELHRGEVYLKNMHIALYDKIEIALCKGKHTYDKKRTIAERDVKRATDRAVKELFK